MGFIRPMSSSSYATNSECRQLLDFGTDTQVRLIEWIHLFQSLQEVAPVGALPDGGLHLPLEKFLFARLLDERALRPDVSMRCGTCAWVGL